MKILKSQCPVIPVIFRMYIHYTENFSEFATVHSALAEEDYVAGLSLGLHYYALQVLGKRGKGWKSGGREMHEERYHVRFRR